MIGLLDYDIQVSTSNQIIIPNLEIMKLATYYKREENTYCRLLDLTDTELASYDKIFFFSELAHNPRIPEQFLRATNVIFGGTAFTEGEYKPFKNSIIDYTVARPTIYKEFLKEKYNNGIKTKVIGHVLDDAYYRIFLNDSILPIPPINARKRIFIYDRNILHNNWQEVITKISDRKPSSILCIHPIICKTITDFINVRACPKIARTNTVILDLNIPLTEIHYLLKSYKHLFLADITKATAVAIFLGGTYPTTTHYYKDFIYKMNLLYSFWAKGIELKIKYDYPKTGYKNPLQELELEIENWVNSPSKNNRTLEERTTKYLSKEHIMTLTDEKQRLYKFYPEAKNLFNQNFTMLKQGGYWKL